MAKGTDATSRFEEDVNRRRPFLILHGMGVDKDKVELFLRSLAAVV